jgi:integrase
MPRKKRHRRHVTIAPNQRKTVYGKTKAELEEKVRRLKAEVNAGQAVPNNRATVTDVAESWLPWHVRRRSIAESSELQYRQLLNRHIIPLFGQTPIQHLTEIGVMAKLAHRSDMSTSSQRKILLTLRLVIKHGIRQGLIGKDPTVDIPLPQQVNQTDKDMHCMSTDQAQAFLDSCEGTRFGNLFTVLLATGMRQGELLALHVDDLIDDFTAIRIRRTLSDDRNGRPKIRNQPKTAAGRRTIPIPELARDAIIDERKQQVGSPHKLLFSTADGTPIERQNLIRRHFRPIVKAANLTEAMTIHDLRHTYATLALNAGVGVHLVSKMLGHASIKVTIDLYSHALPEATTEVANVMQQALTGTKKPTPDALISSRVG